MKPSLEDERRALLEQIEASRALYRRMLSGEPGPAVARRTWHEDTLSRHNSSAGTGQRALQWMVDHPLWVAGGVALIVLLAPRAMSAGKQMSRKRAVQRREPEPVQQGGTLRALLTAAVLLLRDPARMRAAARFAQTAWHWMQSRRNAAAQPSTRLPARTTRLP